jgi:hypothetical protein
MAQQWEYCDLQVWSGQNRSVQQVLFYGPSGGIKRELTAGTVDKATYALGMAGWELVSTTEAGGLGTFFSSHWTFKRPVQPDRRIDDAAF